jgi:exoribonuclease-2
MVIFPKGSANPPPSKSQPQADTLLNRFVHYDDDGELVLGVVVGLRKDKYLVANVRGRELELAKQRLYVLPSRAGAIPPTPSARNELLSALARDILSESQALNVAELWSFVHEDIRVYSVEELCESYFGSNTLEKHAGLRVALAQEKVHFKRDKEGFEPRSAEVVKDLQRAEEVRRLKSEQREETIETFRSRLTDPSIPLPQHVEENVALLSEIAAGVHISDPARNKEAKELVQLCIQAIGLPENLPLEKQAFQMLVMIGHFHRDTNLSLIRHEIPVQHPQAAIVESAAVNATRELADFSDAERSFRRDMTGKYTFTIDDNSTQDMDDALSLEQTVSGWELGIHITDVSWLVKTGTALDASAKRRATSLYCADQTINMLPEALSELSLSLRQGAVRACLSVIVSLTPDYRIESSAVVPTFIKVARRYSYDDVDAELEEGNPTLLTLHEIAAACEARRIQSGANRVHRREAVPFLEQDGSIRLLEIDEDSPARSLIAEMMVLANAVMARFAAEHRIPVLFRGQERPDDVEGSRQQVGEGAPEGPAKDFSARTKLKKSTVSFEPRYHSGLGLDAYIQATSPIRRYLDLCHQRQFISYLRTGQPLLTQEEFEPVAAEVETYLQAAQIASRETRRYWLLRYLEQRPKNKPIAATVVRLDLKSPLVELDEIYITSFVRSQRGLKIGARISLMVSAVDPTGDYLRLEVVG